MNRKAALATTVTILAGLMVLVAVVLAMAYIPYFGVVLGFVLVGGITLVFFWVLVVLPIYDYYNDVIKDRARDTKRRDRSAA